MQLWDWIYSGLQGTGLNRGPSQTQVYPFYGDVQSFESIQRKDQSHRIRYNDIYKNQDISNNLLRILKAADKIVS